MLTLVIQAGGQSKRMGKDKALLTFLGQTLIERILGRLEPLADEIIITTNQPETYQFLEYRLVEDLLPGRGALGGLLTAISAATLPLVAIVACDMPFANPDLLSAEKGFLEDLEYDAAIPHPTYGTEPFHAVYRKETCLPKIQAALDTDQWRADSWFSQANIRFLTQEEIQLYDPLELAFWNVNTPDELARAEERAKSI